MVGLSMQLNQLVLKDNNLTILFYSGTEMQLNQLVLKGTSIRHARPVY